MDSWDLWGPILLLQRKSLFISPEDVALADALLDQVGPLVTTMAQYTGCGRNITMAEVPKLTNLLTDAFFNFGIDR